VGGNNSGKTSVLQGIHFSICAAMAARQIERDLLGDV
jgi:predicted ATP-dependent endonuclease of OLD family